jgi:hypothetical protein
MALRDPSIDSCPKPYQKSLHPPRRINPGSRTQMPHVLQPYPTSQRGSPSRNGMAMESGAEKQARTAAPTLKHSVSRSRLGGHRVMELAGGGHRRASPSAAPAPPPPHRHHRSPVTPRIPRRAALADPARALDSLPLRFVLLGFFDRRRGENIINGR